MRLSLNPSPLVLEFPRLSTEFGHCMGTLRPSATGSFLSTIHCPLATNGYPHSPCPRSANYQLRPSAASCSAPPLPRRPWLFQYPPKSRGDRRGVDLHPCRGKFALSF